MTAPSEARCPMPGCGRVLLISTDDHPDLPNDPVEWHVECPTHGEITPGEWSIPGFFVGLPSQIRDGWSR